MIGPHIGKELEMMLSGKKRLSVFYDVIIEGQEISEEIIPEQAFAPYVLNGLIKRFEQRFASRDCIVKYVCFTLPCHEWRAEAIFWLHQEGISGRRPFDEAHEFFVGRLLDYSEEDIQDFINQASHLKNPRLRGD